MSNTHYDEIANEYKESKKQHWRSIEEHTLFSRLPDLSGLKVLDIACGDGIYTRKLVERGAKDILGIDISSKMVELAQQEESKNPLGTRYEVGDAAGLEYEQTFDLVFAAYLFNYAQTPAELASYCKSIFKSLKPGGRLISMNDNPHNAPEDYGLYEKYGFVKSCTLPRTTGTPITYTIKNPDGSEFTFDNYFHTPTAYLDAFVDAGFQQFQWINPELSTQHLAASDVSHWDCFIEKPPVIAMQAFRDDS